MLFAEWIGIVAIAVAMVFVVRHEVMFFFSWVRRQEIPQTKVSLFVHCVFLIGIVLLAYAFFVEPYWLEVKHVEISTEKLKRVDFTLVQIADLHCDVQQRNERKIVELVNKINPDIIVFTGDSINVPQALPVFKHVLSNLTARLGKIAVKGNWDVWYWKDFDLFNETGFQELNGKAETFLKEGEAISIAGFNPDEQISASNIFDLAFPDMYNILLYHYPGINEEIENNPFNLILSGHTHGGQVALPFYGAIITLSQYGKKYESGVYLLARDKMLYVSRGVGMEGGAAPRVRFLSRPEITVFHIKPEKTKE